MFVVKHLLNFGQINLLNPLRQQTVICMAVDNMTESNVRKWEHVLRGQPLPYRVLDANLQGVLDMEVRENDVFVVSYPKAGTNWLRAIINCMLKCPENQNNMSLPLEMSMSSGTSQQEIEAAPPVFKIVQSWTSPRVMFTHLMPHLLPSHLSERGAKVVYICRNPKDVSVSYYYFRKTLRSKVQAPSLDVYIQQFMQGEVVYGSYFTHVKQYWEMKDKSNLLFIKYEDLKKDENAVIGEIATFLGRDLDADEIANISRQCSVPSMRTTFKTASQAVSVIMDQSKGEFVRKGEVGSWKETLTEAQSQRFDTLLSDHLAGTGLTFDFE